MPEAARLTKMFRARVDGEVASERGPAGRPAPDTFVTAAEMLGVPLGRACVVEDALSGVPPVAPAGWARGRVDRVGKRGALLRGAAVVVDDLAELLDD